MMLLRRAREEDLFAIHDLAKSSGVGLTTLPKEMDVLKTRLAYSTASFANQVRMPTNEYYLFVLEDSENKRIVGTSAIEASTGYTIPFYSYRVSKRTGICHPLHIRNNYEVLSLVNDNQGHTELCTLFLEPTYRRNNNGNLLSRARFLFIANHPQRFAKTVIADMRGISDEDGNSPFWNHVGYHFFCIPFAEADRLTLATNKQFIADLMPRNLIYVNLLAKEAQEVIGKPHPTSLKAMNILLQEGFRYNNYVDIFDAGPTLEAKRESILTIARSRPMKIKEILPNINSAPYLMANTSLDFRATVGPILINDQTTCSLNYETADLLQVKHGDDLRCLPLKEHYDASTPSP